MEAKVLGLFPTPMMIVNLEEAIDHREIKKLLKVEKDTDNLLINENRNYFTRENNILNTLLKTKSTLKELFQKHVDIFIKETMGEGDAKLKIHLSWMNFNPKGTSHHKHIHPNSIVSGVFYIRTNEKSGNFHVHRDDFKSRMIRDRITNYNDFNYDFYYFTPKPYDLYLFPSNLSHSVMPNESDETRVSLSFNTFYEGEIRTDDYGWLSSLWVGDISSGTPRTNDMTQTMSKVLTDK
jgi:uncharacterized protein (TIGR02466 family)